MTIAGHALAAAGIAASAVAALSLWLTARRRSGRTGLGYLWLSGAAAFWCLGVVAQQVLGPPLGGAAVGLTLADLPPLLALVAVVAGVVMLAAGSGGKDRDGWRTLGHRVAGRPVIPRLADGFVLAAAGFVIGWIALFGPDYIRSGSGPGAFTVALLQVMAGLVAAGLLLPMVCETGGATVPPFAAVLLVTVSDALGVSARLGGSAPGAAQQATALAAFCVLGLTPWLAASWPDRGRTAGSRAAAIASGAAAVAALVACVWALASGHGAPALVVVASAAVLALALRVLSALADRRRGPRTSLESGRRFRELARLTSDVVLVCDHGGIIRYASPAAADYGYPADGLPGRPLDQLVHPEDRPGSRRAVAAALRRPSEPPVRFGCRVRAADGTWRHVEAAVSPYRHPGGADELLVTARDVSDQVALRRQVTHLTFHDGLTGLPNRAYLEDRAAAALGRDEAGGPDPGWRAAQRGVIFLDLDGFTAVNDSVGHRAGDLLIAQAARRLRAAVPPQETVVRWGGDEFAVLVGGSADGQAITELAERLTRAVAAEPFRVADRDISLTASVGVAFAGSDPPGIVLRNADVAMARAKESGGRVEVFADQMHQDVVRRLELISGLQRAITDGQLVVHYQPVVELTTSRVSGAEALVRWWRGGAAVPPGEFLGVAEESGLIVPLGQWVLRQACAQAARWCRSAAGIGVSVNFSPRQVSAERFPETVLAALADAGLPPGALTLEVTERALVEAAGPAVAHLAELRRAGVRLAIDDFGTGYASLAYLRQLPVDIIKIDPSFVAGLGTDETLTLLTRTIIQLGHDLGIGVVAEGIESSQQLGLLREMGCELGQGYLVAAPMAAAEVETLISTTLAQPGGGAVPSGPEAEPEAFVSLSETHLRRG